MIEDGCILFKYKMELYFEELEIIVEVYYKFFFVFEFVFVIVLGDDGVLVKCEVMD